MPRFLCAATAALALMLPLSALGQSVTFGQRADVKAPVEVTADSLSVDQSSGLATFTGHVVIGQGAMRLAADKVTVTYAPGGQNRISTLQATGNVTLVNGPDAAEAARADYSVESGNVILTGDVILTQGQNVLSGETVQVNLATGTANVAGRVRSVFQPDAAQ